MWSRRPVRAVALLIAGLLVAAVAPPVAGVVVPASADASASTPPAPSDGNRLADGGLQERPDPATVLRVNLTSEGDARWTVTSRFALPNESDRAEFRRFVADLRNGTDPEPRVGYSPATFDSLADRVGSTTGRSGMAVVDPSWDGTVRNGTGEVSLSFTWTNFARVDGDRVLLDDVFRADVGFVTSLSADQRLVIAPPPGYAVSDTPFPTEDGTIRVDGADDVPADVTDGNASVVYVPRAGIGPTGEGVPVALLGGGLLVAVLLALGAASLYRDRQPDDPDTPPATASDPDANSPDAPTGPDPDTPPTTEVGPGPDTDTADGPAPTDTATDDPTADGTTVVDATADVDEELLSDEERVERLLATNGGRMKQATIVSETGWSNAKVSQLLSAMDDADRIDKLRIGRENLISLPDESVVDLDADASAEDAEEGGD